MYLLLSLVLIGVLLIVNEWRYRRKDVKIERSRKLAHILIGCFAALWPFYLSWDSIRLISLLFLVGVVISKALKLFASIHEIERFSLGEICFALAVGALTFVTQNKWVYAVSLLQMSLADGLAAIIGTRYGSSSSYTIFGAKKSGVGSVTFLLTSILIILVGRASGHIAISIPLALMAAVISTITENIAIYGSDNLLLPIVTALIITHG